jgi:predicted nucleic acid-binding protein
MIDALPHNRLGPGELAVIAYAYPGSVAGLDDLQARRIAEALGLMVAGTLGLLLRAKRASLVPAVRPLMDTAVAEGFHISPELYRVMLDLADEVL